MRDLEELLERARHCRESGSFDGLHGELLDMVEAQRDRASEQSAALMEAAAQLRGLRELCDRPFDVLEVEQGDGRVVATAVVTVADIRARLAVRIRR